MEYVAAIISALGAIVIGWFTYNQRTKDKLTDFKIEQWKAEADKTLVERTAIYSDIFSKLHSLIHELDADRIYIIQPHPLIENLFLSVTLEATHPYRDVTRQKNNMQNLRIEDWGWLTRKLQEEYLAYADVNAITDLHTRSEFSIQGIKSIVAVRMTDTQGRWIGNLCADFTHRKIDEVEIPQIKEELKNDSLLIQFKLPEYDPAMQN